MGNCFGKPSGNNFSGEGRTLGSAPQSAPIDQAPRPVPVLQPSAIGGSANGAGAESEARSAAARAAEERAAKAQAAAQKGKLSQSLAQQKAQTQSDLLQASANDERRFREVDQGTAALQHA